jgi:hypothetical protein
MENVLDAESEEIFTKGHVPDSASVLRRLADLLIG